MSFTSPAEAKQLRPVGEFNQSRIVVRGSHIEHWLNGVRIVLVDVSAGSGISELPRANSATLKALARIAPD